MENLPRVLKIENLHVAVSDSENNGNKKEILKGLNLEIKTGEIHAIMGPNGTGKSTLAGTIMGHYKYEVTDGSITLDGEDLETFNKLYNMLCTVNYHQYIRPVQLHLSQVRFNGSLLLNRRFNRRNPSWW